MTTLTPEQVKVLEEALESCKTFRRQDVDGDWNRVKTYDPGKVQSALSMLAMVKS